MNFTVNFTVNLTPFACRGVRTILPETVQESIYSGEDYVGLRHGMHAGQSVVQMCADVHSGCEFAVKFFLSTSAFVDEVNLYQDLEKPLGRFLPEVHRIVYPADGFTDSRGAPMPACMVMEKGESLDRWVARGDNGLDRVTGLQVSRSSRLRNHVT